jgi:hypothetical protein
VKESSLGISPFTRDLILLHHGNLFGWSAEAEEAEPESEANDHAGRQGLL